MHFFLKFLAKRVFFANLALLKGLGEEEGEEEKKEEEEEVVAINTWTMKKVNHRAENDVKSDTVQYRREKIK